MVASEQPFGSHLKAEWQQSLTYGVWIAMQGNNSYVR
jgi:hypothetical protein